VTAPSPVPPQGGASGVWTALREYVAGQDRRSALRAALGLGPGKVEVLLRLDSGPMTLREIALAVDVDPPAATVGVNQLEARGLVHRTAHPDDNRRKLVHLTDAGRDAACRARTILADPPAELAGLDPQDLARLGEILARLQATRPGRAAR
jgi:DNA-binding MarR family transcriptional regulator